jgi:hypothetical protein
MWFIFRKIFVRNIFNTNEYQASHDLDAHRNGGQWRMQVVSGVDRFLQRPGRVIRMAALYYDLYNFHNYLFN